MTWTSESAAQGSWSKGPVPKWGDTGIWWGLANLFWGIGMIDRQGAWTSESAESGAWSNE